MNVTSYNTQAAQAAQAARAIVSGEPLRSILPAVVDASKYDESDLALIERASQNPLARWPDKDAAKTATITALMEVAIAYGFSVDQTSRDDQIAFKECAAIILTQYEVGIEQVRHAFRVSHKTGADLEGYGRRFNAGYLKRVMDAYMRYVNEVLPAIKTKEQRAAKRAEAAARYEREQAEAAAKREAAKRTWPLTQCRLIVRDYAKHLNGELAWHEASSTLILLLKELGMIEGLFDDDDRQSMMDVATETVTRRIRAARLSANPATRTRATVRVGEIERGVISPETKAAILAEYCNLGLRQFFISYALEWDVRDMANQLYLAMKRAGKTTKEEFLQHVDVDAILSSIEAEKAEKQKQQQEAEAARMAAIQRKSVMKQKLAEAKRKVDAAGISQ